MAEAVDRWKFVSPQGINGAPIVGPDIASAATIAPTHLFHRVTGTTAVDTITPPYPDFSGVIYLLPTGLGSFSASGNIAVAVTSVVNKLLQLFYNPVTAKWYPSYVA